MIGIRRWAAAAAATFAAIWALPAIAGAPQPGDAPRPFDVRDLLAMNRIADIDSAPDGRHLTYTVEAADLEANEFRSSVWLLDPAVANPAPVRLTDTTQRAHAASWSADGRHIYFLSSRSGSSQVWRMNADGRNPVQITNLPLDVDTYRVSPRADRIVVTLRVFRHCRDIGCTQQRLAASSQAGGAIVRKQLFVGHWNEWEDGRRSQLYSILLDKKGIATGEPVRLNIDIEGDVPGRPFGGREDYTVSPDGQRLAFSERGDGARESWAPNADIYTAFASGGERAPNGRPLKDADPVNVTPDDKAEDLQPAFSPDGSQLAYLAADRPGGSASQRLLVLQDFKSGARRVLTQDWDHSIVRFVWTPDGRRLIASCDHQGARTLWRIDARTGAAGELTSGEAEGGGSVESFSVGGRWVYYSLGSLDSPPDIYSIGIDGGKPVRLTRLNGTLLGQRRLVPSESFSFPGWNREAVHGHLLKPADLEPARKYALVVILHDGPHESLGNNWDWRLNAQLIAAAGFGVALIDFHGSAGYGRGFSDSVANDLGGKPLEDVKAGLEFLLGKYSWLDENRVCALGAGYGGYLVNLIAGESPRRFRCLVNHAGIFDLRTAYYTTDELSAPEAELGGTEFDNPAAYALHNPIDRVKTWRTPMLISHGQLDYRVPYSQGLAAFTALQRVGWPGELLLFPDEGHWVAKPVNTLQWYESVISWLRNYARQ